MHYVRIPPRPQKKGAPPPTRHYSHRGKLYKVDSDPAQPIWYRVDDEKLVAELREIVTSEENPAVFEVLTEDQWKARISRPVNVTVVGEEPREVPEEEAGEEAPGRVDIGKAPKAAVVPKAKKAPAAAPKAAPKAKAPTAAERRKAPPSPDGDDKGKKPAEVG